MRNDRDLVRVFLLVFAAIPGLGEGGFVSTSRQVINNALATVGQDSGKLTADLLQPVLKLSISAASTAVVVYLISVATFRGLQAFDRGSQESAARESRQRAWSRVSMLEISEDGLPSYSRSLGFGPRPRSLESSFQEPLCTKRLQSSPAIEIPF